MGFRPDGMALVGAGLRKRATGAHVDKASVGTEELQDVLLGIAAPVGDPLDSGRCPMVASLVEELRMIELCHGGVIKFECFVEGREMAAHAPSSVMDLMIVH